MLDFIQITEEDEKAIIESIVQGMRLEREMQRCDECRDYMKSIEMSVVIDRLRAERMAVIKKYMKGANA